MSKISCTGVFSGKRLRCSHMTLFILLTIQILLCAARPNINNPNPDGIQIRHVPAGRTNPDAKPLTSHLTKRDVGVVKETGELQSRTTAETDDLTSEDAIMPFEEVENNTGIEVVTNKHSSARKSDQDDYDTDDDYPPDEAEGDETTKTYTEMKEATSATTLKPTSTYSLSSMSFESETESAIASSTAAEEIDTTLRTTSITSKHDFSSELTSSSTQSNSENFADVILVSKSSSVSIKRTFFNFILIVPAFVIVFVKFL